MPENRILRFVDWVGEGTLTTAEVTYGFAKKNLEELAKVLREHEIAAKALLLRDRARDEERRRALEARLSRILEAVSEEEEVTREILLEREEVRRPLSERLAEVIANTFLGFSKRLQAYFVNIQEDLYRANIMMTASRYISLAVGVSAILAAILTGAFSVMFWSVVGAVGGLVSAVLFFPFFFIFLTLARMYPKNRVKTRSRSFSRELPFALRHMATQLSSGSGLLETMRSISLSDYGVLSEEFRRAILEIERGSTIEEAYERMNLRIDSPGLRKASRQIISTMRTGGNLASTLKVIADEVATDMRMKLKDFIQTLNTFSLMYMFVVVVAPVLISTLLIALGIATKSFPVPVETMWLLYLTFFGISLYMAFIIKRFEPRV
jgi:flagellar protein FlaJ